jgi:predicted CopG family antitoxin
MGKTTIELSDDTADRLYAMKDRGDSYEDVILRLLNDE